MWANNEVGTVQPIAELAAVAHEYGVPLHTDAVQAVSSLPVDFAASGVDALTMTGHKLGGPYGAGALLLRRTVACTPLLHGGGQERDVRSGTLDVPGAIGLATATTIAVERRARARRAAGRAARPSCVAGLRDVVPDIGVNGHPDERLPGLAHVTFPGCEGDSLLMLLDAQGVECSTGSACAAGVAQPSHVLLAMGADAEPPRVARCASRSATPPRPRTWTPSLAAIGPAVERARRAGLTSVAS